MIAGKIGLNDVIRTDLVMLSGAVKVNGETAPSNWMVAPSTRSPLLITLVSVELLLTKKLTTLL
jgi:hypothetical protein